MEAGSSIFQVNYLITGQHIKAGNLTTTAAFPSSCVKKESVSLVLSLGQWILNGQKHFYTALQRQLSSKKGWVSLAFPVSYLSQLHTMLILTNSLITLVVILNPIQKHLPFPMHWTSSLKTNSTSRFFAC